ncbi:RHS repeat-associated core domain-containing protein [Candidatus Gracilibacteria bacterium]|nr:RHS repeat-associated core domain-containing protein [Candidatus Gracilibacteria bacterium]
MSQSGLVQTVSLSTSSGTISILPESQSGITQTGTTTTTSSGEIITNTGTTFIISSDTASGGSVSGSYMIIAGYVASNSSGSTPINLTTTLTHIMLGDERIATFQTQTDDTPKTSDDEKLVYHISDHLNSSSLDLSNTGIILQATDYEPFGKSITYEVMSKRIKGKKGGYTNKYLFANKQLDDETDLQYFEKRYYDNRIGKFTTEDPVFWEVGSTFRPTVYFTDPEQWNSYSYTRNNPINYTDPTGEALGGDVWNPIGDTVSTAIVIGGAVGYVGGKAVDGLGKLAGMAIEGVYNSLSNISSTKTISNKTIVPVDTNIGNSDSGYMKGGNWCLTNICWKC